MADLSAKSRRKYAVIKPGPGEPASAAKFPIPDKGHASAALGRLGQAKGLSAQQKAKVRAKAISVLRGKS